MLKDYQRKVDNGSFLLYCFKEKIAFFDLPRFKDHKKCSHMIANAMDGDGKFTAPQVSRKLKQLGLHIPRKKRPSGGMLKDEDHSDSNANKMHDSDDETLFSLMKR